MSKRLHSIKINKDFADSVFSGDKTFELRLNDRGYQKGDVIKFIPIDRFGCEMINHPLRTKEYEISYVLNGFGLDKDWVAFAIKPAKEMEG